MSASPTETLPPAVPGPVLPELVADSDDLVTEDHKPVEGLYVEKMYRLLTRPLYASWPGPGPERNFLVLVNVGWFYHEKTPAVVPDCLLSLDVTCPEDLHQKEGHSYYQWKVGKQPDIIVEIVSDKTGGEEGYKKNLYARLGVPYYAVYDPRHLLSEHTLTTYELVGGRYRTVEPGPWPSVGLGLRLWEGSFEGHHDTWLRWCDASGQIVPTGEERAAQMAVQASQAAEREAQMAHRIRELEEEVRRLKGQQPPPA